MVAIKIQNAEDILGAILKTIGFEKAEIPQSLLEKIDERNVLKSFDNLLLKQAKKVLDKNLSDEQKIALFKIIFIKNNGAQKWGFKIFDTDFELPETDFAVVPEYKLSKMKAQKL